MGWWHANLLQEKFCCSESSQAVRASPDKPALPDFLSSSGSGTGSTQPREVNWGATWIKSSGSGPEKRLTAVGIRCADHVTPLYPQKLALTSPIGGGRSVGIVRSRTKATEFSFLGGYTQRWKVKEGGWQQAGSFEHTGEEISWAVSVFGMNFDTILGAVH